MNKIIPIGIKVNALPRQLTFVRTLEEFEYAILSVHKAKEGSGLYIEKLCTSDNNVYRYLIVRTEQRSVAEYLGKKISLLSLLTDASDGGGFLVDRKSDGSILDIHSIRFDQLPKGYLPQKVVFHDESLRPEWKDIPQHFLLETWDAKLLAIIEKRYKDVYGFSYVAMKGSNEKISGWILDYDYDGGYSYMHAFNRLRNAPPPRLQARSVGVAASSPGVLTIDAPSTVAMFLNQCFLVLPSVGGLYEAVYKWSRLSPAMIEKMPANAIKDLRALCDGLEIRVEALLPEPSERYTDPYSNPRCILAAGKLVASFYRRMWKLLDPEKGVEYLSVTTTNQNISSPEGVYDDDGENSSEM
ncbi:MAG: hypothetical protein K2Q26_09050 [Bdellovibrionales bacterium]|nr:hypothetical protein [Bdellovibrionales bacterium]